MGEVLIGPYDIIEFLTAQSSATRPESSGASSKDASTEIARIGLGRGSFILTGLTTGRLAFSLAPNRCTIGARRRCGCRGLCDVGVRTRRSFGDLS